jgi:hypothetical protein
LARRRPAGLSQDVFMILNISWWFGFKAAPAVKVPRHGAASAKDIPPAQA